MTGNRLSCLLKKSAVRSKLEQAGTGPSRRHIQGSKIAKRLPSVKYSLLQYSKIENFSKKIDRVARRGSLARAPGALKSHNAEKLKGGTLCGFSTSILSQNVKKLKKTKIFIFGKKSQCRKKLKGGTLWDFSTSILSQNIKKNAGGGALWGIFFSKTGKTFLVQFARPNSAF